MKKVHAMPVGNTVIVTRVVCDPHSCVRRRCPVRRGAIAVKVAVLMVIMLGFGAMAVDIGLLYNARAELQRTADASSLAAAAMLGTYAGEGEDPVALAREKAQEFALLNAVWGVPIQLDATRDIIFGKAVLNEATHTYEFQPTEEFPDAVRVIARRTEDSANGPMQLFLGGVLGVYTSDVTAQSTSVMMPRDIAIVADLSASHNDDSELRNYQAMNINLHQVWDDLPGGIDDGGNEWDGLGYDEDSPQAAGPAWGLMKVLGYGTDPIEADYDPLADTGLIKLNYRGKWVHDGLSNYLAAYAGVGYNDAEIDNITDGGNFDGFGGWERRAAVALGVARWRSGRPDGLWERLGLDPAEVGNGDSRIDASELEWVEPIWDRTLSESADIWSEYFSYLKDRFSEMCRANVEFRFQAGVKTFTNFLMERRYTNELTPELAETRAQPMHAVKEAVGHMVDVMTELNTEDLLSLEVYGTTGRHEVNLTHTYPEVSDRIGEMQAGYYDAWTNMGDGIKRGIEELSGERHRSTARSVMILLTDGQANVNENGQTADEAGGREYALAQATLAASQGIRIFAVSVGSGADTETMAEIADIGDGKHYHVEGSIEDYSDQLDEIFAMLGGDRQTALIE